MKKINRNALLPYSAEALFCIVNDVNAYPEFLPWCNGAEVLESSEHKMIAKVGIAKAGISQYFTTENKLVYGERIELSLIDGPFSHLHGVWTFKALDESACKIELELEFEVSNSLLNMALSSVFEQVVSTMVQSFCERAKNIL